MMKVSERDIPVVMLADGDTLIAFVLIKFFLETSTKYGESRKLRRSF